MSTLEVSFRQAFFARPRVGTIAAPDRVTLSRWFTKTAVLLAHAAGCELLGADRRRELIRGMPDDVEVFVGRRRRPPQRLDFTVDMTDAGAARSVAIVIDDLVGNVATSGTLRSRTGTRLWPLRSHILRWETLPVISGH
ncbi:MAG: hypothetical protein ABR525_08900 [Candidatus Limnocylindria bacterium]